MSLKLFKALEKLQPNAEFVITDNDLDSIKWKNLDGDAPTKVQIENTIKEIENQELVEFQAKTQAKAALLDRLGITPEEATLLLS
jgi:hypothetical protein